MTSTRQIQQLAAYPSPLPAALPVQDFGTKLLDMLAIPAFVLDLDGKVIIWNRACERLTGVAADEVLGTRNHARSFYAEARPMLADLVIQNRLTELDRLYPRIASGNPDGQLSVESWCDMPRSGRRRYLALDASPILDQHGELEAVVQTLRDVTDQKATQTALEQLATRDGLTGLANRRCFDETLKSEWARAMRQGQPLSLLMVDVDNFKAYNDINGHMGGDECLKRVATALASEMRANDLVARYGGEEFAVILPNQSLKGAAIVAERVRERVERLCLPRVQAPCMDGQNTGQKNGQHSAQKNGQAGAQHVTVSIGAATAYASPDNQPSQLVATADAALYRAKHMGRNRISLPLTEAPGETAGAAARR